LLQTLPQLPQLWTSVCVLMQVPLHSDWPLGQAQVPFWQVRPLVHTVPHVPQLAGSMLVFTHAVPHSVAVVPVQFRPHTPAVQVAVPVPAVGAGQTVPQVPQWLTSLAVFTQAGPQSVAVGAVQLRPHTPHGCLGRFVLPTASRWERAEDFGAESSRRVNRFLRCLSGSRPSGHVASP
jgi:hypothetical protein